MEDRRGGEGEARDEDKGGGQLESAAEVQSQKGADVRQTSSLPRTEKLFRLQPQESRFSARRCSLAAIQLANPPPSGRVQRWLCVAKSTVVVLEQLYHAIRGAERVPKTGSARFFGYETPASVGRCRFQMRQVGGPTRLRCKVQDADRRKFGAVLRRRLSAAGPLCSRQWTGQKRESHWRQVANGKTIDEAWRWPVAGVCDCAQVVGEWGVSRCLITVTIEMGGKE